MADFTSAEVGKQKNDFLSRSIKHNILGILQDIMPLGSQLLVQAAHNFHAGASKQIKRIEVNERVDL